MKTTARTVLVLSVLAAGLSLAGCQSNGATNPTPTRTKSFKYSNTDGQTMATAVEVRTRSGTEGGVLMKDWIRANHPGFTITDQELIPDTVRSKMYNLITLVGPNNESKRVYFDVTQFYERVGGSLPSASFPPR
ncbi:MAG TPA: hypothetical protein VMF52_11110 [Steroidobacteraceae bacterium]|nr:hypothetical protein [Steroidobacteraceae bacterium]